MSSEKPTTRCARCSEPIFARFLAKNAPGVVCADCADTLETERGPIWPDVVNVVLSDTDDVQPEKSRLKGAQIGPRY